MPNINEINYFRVTNRTFEKINENLKIAENYLLNLPTNAKVLEVGSGANQEFANGLKKIRPDIITVSLDPTFALQKGKFAAIVTDWEAGKPTAVMYDSLKNSDEDEENYFQMVQDSRIKNANETGNVISALAPKLPFQDNSFDLIIDSWAAGYYLRSNLNDTKEYLEDLIRIIKPGGEIRISPLFDKHENVESKKKIKYILKSLNSEIKLIDGLSFYGVIIKKKQTT